LLNPSVLAEVDVLALERRVLSVLAEADVLVPLRRADVLAEASVLVLEES